MITAKDLLSTKYAKIDVKDTISKMLGKTKEATYYAVVFDGEKYVGVIGKRFLITARINPEQMKVNNILKRRHKAKTPLFVPELSLDTELPEICRLFATADVHVLPVIEKRGKAKRVLGVVDAHEAAGALGKFYARVPASEVATMPAVVVHPNIELGYVIKIMGLKHIDRLPVVDENNKIAGILSLADILGSHHLRIRGKGQRTPRAAGHNEWAEPGYESGEKIDSLRAPINSIMTRFPMVSCIKPETPIPEAIKQMEKDDVASVVLLEDDEPAGILTLRDIFTHFTKNAEKFLAGM